MKKTLLFTLASLSLGLFFVSCASNKINLNDYSKSAVISVEGNKIIYPTNDRYEVNDRDKSGYLTTTINTMINSDNPEIMTAQNRVDYAEESLKRILEEINEIEFIEKETLLNAKNYKIDQSNFLGFSVPSLRAEGYKRGLLDMSRKSAKLLLKEIEANSLISANFEFDKRQTTSKVYAVVKMRVKLFNAEGKKIINKEYIAESANYIETAVGINSSYDKDAFVELFPDTIDSVITKFAMDYIN